MTTLTNLLSHGDFEGSGWSGAVSAWDTSHVRYGSHSCRVDGDTGSAEKCIYHDGGAQMVQGHVYYGRYEVYHEGAQGSAGMYFPEAEPAFFEGHSLGSAGKWNLVSGLNVRSSWSSGVQTVRVDYNNQNTAGSVWIDGALLVDLTAAFGAGSEPTKSWCDSNIPFFLGSLDIDTSPIQGLSMSVSLQPNPADVGQTLMATVTAQTVTSRGFVLPVAEWEGEGPYEMLLAVSPDITPDSECIVYADHEMTLVERMAEMNAILRAEVTQPGRIRFRALSIRPTADIRLRVVTGMFPVMFTVTVPQNRWTGSGPWFANVDIGRSIQSATVAAVSGSSDEQVENLTDSGIHVSDINGSIVTLRSMLYRPSVDLMVGVMGI